MVTSTWPLAHSEPYLRWTTPTAAPKCISGRTSYLWVRLEFLPYPQLIPQFCNTGGFGPRRGLTLASPWPWVAHPVSGLICATYRPIKTRFRCGSSTLPYLNLAAQINSPDHSSIGTPLAAEQLPKKLSNLPLTACGYMVSGLFHRPPGLLFTFPSRYLFTIGRQEYLALEGGPPCFPQDFSCPVVLRLSAGVRAFSFTGLSPSAAGLSRAIQLALGFFTPIC